MERKETGRHERAAKTSEAREVPQSVWKYLPIFSEIISYQHVV